MKVTRPDQARKAGDAAGSPKAKKKPEAAPARGWAPKATSRARAAQAKTWSPPATGQWTDDAHGVRSDPVNLYVHGPLDTVKATLIDAGWVEASANNRENNAKYLAAVPVAAVKDAADAAGNVIEGAVKRLTGKQVNLDVVGDERYRVASMAVSPQTLDGRPNVTSFQKNNDPLGGRDHLRIFDTGSVDRQGRPVWAIAASRDTSITFDKRRPEQGFLNHAVEANTDKERDFVFASIRDSVLVASSESVAVEFGQTPAPATGALPQDGRVYDVVLK